MASAKATIGALTKSCSGLDVIKKSHAPVSPASGSTESSTPEKRAMSGRNDRLSSTRTGAMMSSERAFSVPIAVARGTL
ncbi:MAG: hypothetical protein U0359_40725 [Byssovorax sp.]